ncbi:MAG: selenocysteine-specific translation elongation factor [Candidatus Thorarchaeota archaeon]
MDSLVPVHIGLMGHIDHGKTELARAISDKVSTAGLDKHPQAKERGITIDLGFTMFVLDKYLVTLVDAPGHADLIRSVVAGANIIDTAIMTVAADEGPKIQTGEHLVVLRSMDIDSLVVAITKSELVDDRRLAEVEDKMKKIVQDAGFVKTEFVRVSAHTGHGIDDLRKALLNVLVPRTRSTKGPILMPIDHAFSVKGHGTVVTGTIFRGSLSTNDSVEISPTGLTSKVRSIQTFGSNRPEASAGDRIGVNIPEIDHTQITRGDYLCSPKTIPISPAVIIRAKINPLYQGRITKKMVINVAIGMPMVTAQIIPFEERNELRVVVDDIKTGEFSAALVLQRPIAIDERARVLLLRTDLPPTHMRIMGSGSITKLEDVVLLSKKKVRAGKVQRIREDDVLVEGLASSKGVAESLTGAHVSIVGGAGGIIRSPFGTRGVVSVTFDSDVKEEDEVHYERLVEEEYGFGQR